MPTIGYNYLNKNKQLKGLAQFRLIVEQRLKNYIDSEPGSVETNRTLENLKWLLAEKSLTKKQCIFTLEEHFKKLSDETSTAISDREIEDVEILLIYFKEVEQLLIDIAQLMNTLEPQKSFSIFNENRMANHLTSLIKLCKEQYHSFKRALDINIYRVAIPSEHYNSLYNESKTFHYEGRVTAASKVAGGSILYLPATTVSLIPCMLLLIPAAYDFPGARRLCQYVGVLDKQTRVRCEQSVRNGIVRYGHGCKSIILPEWIQALLKPHGEERNPYYGGLPGPFKTIYVLDARDPKKTFAEGVNYTEIKTPINPHGKIIFFENLRHARECAELRSSELYDPVAGWRLYNTWKEKELADIYSFSKFRKIITSSTTLPTELADIVTEFLGRPTPSLSNK